MKGLSTYQDSARRETVKGVKNTYGKFASLLNKKYAKGTKRGKTK